jgi:hypothetical protein
MCAIERVEKLDLLVAALGRRILSRQAEYEMTHAAWLRNRERWSFLSDDEFCGRLRAECRAESVRLDARCRALTGRIKQLNRALWEAEMALAAAQDAVAVDSAAFLGSHFSRGPSAKFSPPGRAACADAGCPEDAAFSISMEIGRLTLRSEGNRVGTLEVIGDRCMVISQEVDGRASA